MTCDFCHNAQGPLDHNDTGVFLLELGMGGHPGCAYRVQDTLTKLRTEDNAGLSIQAHEEACRLGVKV